MRLAAFASAISSSSVSTLASSSAQAATAKKPHFRKRKGPGVTASGA